MVSIEKVYTLGVKKQANVTSPCLKSTMWLVEMRWRKDRLSFPLNSRKTMNEREGRAEIRYAKDYAVVQGKHLVLHKLATIEGRMDEYWAKTANSHTTTLRMGG